MAAVLGIVMLVMQRWIAETRDAAIVLVAAWLAVTGLGVWIATRRRRGLRLALAGTWLAVVIGTIAIGYWTGFRDSEVMETVAVASARASGSALDSGLSGGGDGNRGGERSARAEPVELASGSFAGVDGHAGAGTATVIEQPNGERVLTFTEFDVDPGPGVEVYLTASPENVSDRVELGGLKGNVGDQQYAIPEGTDLRRYSNIVVWCTPFTVRIAVAELS